MVMSLSTTVDGLPEFTAAQMLRAVQHAIVRIAVDGQSASIAGRMYTESDLDKLRKMRDVLTAEVEMEGSPTGTLTALGRFGTQQ